MSRVDEINDIETLSDYRLLWNSLLAQTRGASFFQSLDWLQAYWKHFGQNERLRVLVVHSDQKPIGIVPLTVLRERTRAGTVRVLTYPLHDWGSFYGPLGPHPAATLMAALRHVRETRRDWDMLDLRWVDRDGHDRGRTRNAMGIAGFGTREAVWKTIAMVDTSGPWEAYLAGRSPKLRRNIRFCQKRLHDLGQVQHIRYRPRGVCHGDADPRWDLYDECVRLAGRSWQGSSTTGSTLSTDKVATFFRDTHELAAKQGALDLNLLLIDGQPVSFCYNYHYQGQLFGVRTGYDPDYSHASAGLVLKAMQIEDSIRRGDRWLDLGHGYLEGKRPWATRLVRSHRYTHYPVAVPKAQLLRVKHWLADLSA